MEIDLTDINRRVSKILTVDAAKYIDYYREAKGSKPEGIALSAKQWDQLEVELKKKNRKLAGSTFKGIKLWMCEV